MSMEKLNIIKLGGSIVSDPEKLNVALNSFSQTTGFKILVHGGGNQASKWAKQLDIPIQIIDGRRITDDAMLEIVTMVYGGLLNKKIVAKLQSKKTNALGMSGADGNIISSVRRPVGVIDFGNVGDIREVGVENLISLLNSNFVPTICALTHDGQGNILNTNADSIAGNIAQSMSERYDVTLTYAFELNGVLSNFEDKNSVIPLINNVQFQAMKKDGSINAGMIPKVFNAIEASKNGVNQVYICHYSTLDQANKGTQVCYQ